ncbi:MAG: copper amine oxidase N-terminal domain-containing protein [Armatimonadota bacterium]
MNKKIIKVSMLLMAAGSLMCIPAGAENVTINTSGATPFLYEGNSYLPLQSVASFLGANLSWDTARDQAVVSYNGQDLALTPGNVNALFKGKPVTLPSPPVVVDGRTYVPTAALKNLYNIPIEWDRDRSEVRIKGPNGWGTTKVKSRSPWHGGPPPWAPAWGERRKQGDDNYLSPGKHRQNKGRNESERRNNGRSKDD